MKSQIIVPDYSGNLVPNHSFEDTVACPWASSQIEYAVNWNRPTMGTPDYFHSCGLPGNTSVPSNFAGYKDARTGKAYAGFFSFFNDNRNYKEYIEARLKDSLIAGKEYCLFFYVSLADNFRFASDGIGALLTTDSVYSNNDSVLDNYTPQIVGSTIISDEEGWTYIGGSFIASGGEKYITIGNFSPNINTQTTPVSGLPGINYDGAYYLIDDVYLGPCDTLDTIPVTPPLELPSIIVPNVFTPNGDGVNDMFLVETEGIETISCEIFNRWGIKVAEIKNLGDGWDGRTISGMEASEGVYYYVIKAIGTNKELLTRTGFIQLIR